jgi:protein-tyrosine phosphatase
MRTEFYEITGCPHGRLAIMPRPRGDDWLEGELLSLRAKGVTDLVSMLTRDEAYELGLSAEAELSAPIGLNYWNYPIRDRGLPHQPEFDVFIDQLAPLLLAGRFLVIHCRAGIGRSSVTAAALLCRLGVRPTDAIVKISAARGFQIPDTEEQLQFILGLADS